LIQRDRIAAAEAWLAPRKELEKTRTEGRVTVKETTPGGFTEKADDTEAKDERKAQIDIYDDAIKEYTKRITEAKTYLKDHKPDKDSDEYKAYAKSINENQKQRDITSQRKRDFRYFIKSKGRSSGTQNQQGGNTFDDAVARLRSNPQEAALFDQQFGKGMAAKYLKR
jgi:thymidylate synthase